MQLRLHELETHLAKKLAPIYLISGDEPLQCEETLDRLRAAAKQRGHEERLRFDTGPLFDWDALELESASLSLFASRRILDIRMRGAKPGEAGAKSLARIARDPDPDTVLLISTSKLDAATRKSAWYQALDRVGVCIDIWPVELERLPRWIEERGRRLGLRLTPEATSLLADRVEGNLLACSQELEKLGLLYPDAEIDAQAVLAAVGDSSRYSVFDLVDSALEGRAARTSHILRGLREEGMEATLVVWALGREVRTLTALGFARKRGEDPARRLNAQRVWEKRKRQLMSALGRLREERLIELLEQIARCDRIVKGAQAGDGWDEIWKLALGVAGVNIHTGRAYN